MRARIIAMPAQSLPPQNTGSPVRASTSANDDAA
jgi:hypothetical protein